MARSNSNRGAASAKPKGTDSSQPNSGQQNLDPGAGENTGASNPGQSTNGTDVNAGGTDVGATGTGNSQTVLIQNTETDAARLAEEKRQREEAERLAAEERKNQEAQALLAAQKNEPQTEVPALFIKSRGESFRRCGFRFGKEPIGIALECLSEEHIETLKAEPNLVVEEGAAILGDLQVTEPV